MLDPGSRLSSNFLGNPPVGSLGRSALRVARTPLPVIGYAVTPQPE